MISFKLYGSKTQHFEEKTDSHLVELVILRLLVFSICLRLPQTPEVWPFLDQKWRVVTSQNGPYKFSDRLKKTSQTMSNYCMGRSAKFYVDSAVRF